ncbi:MAG: hypothetical protein ACI9F9_001592 [Candidatus Paceibacteria bacterium]|jgi:hypothetical protein
MDGDGSGTECSSTEDARTGEALRNRRIDLGRECTGCAVLRYGLDAIGSKPACQ